MTKRPSTPLKVNGVALLSLLLLGACTVPQLKDLGEKACDADHPCVTGYTCQQGACKVPTGMPCTEGQTKACGTDVGECVRGTQRCIDGVFGACEGEVGPATEVCDAKDNDCDSATDEDLSTAPDCERQEGVCAGKKKACVAGAYVPTCGAAEYGTDFEASETRCDGKDNDCDGMTDEQVTGGACPNQGVCAGASRTCSMGTPGACVATNYEPNETSCDNLDNDCDGMTDEGVVSSTACALSVGVCSGKFAACRSGAIEATCTAASYGANFEPAEASCDGLDNDCNGVVDRQPDGGILGIGQCELQLGVCTNAKRACLAGNGEAPCTAASYGPQYEASEFSCDGLDNDCDGRPDLSKEVALAGVQNALANHISLAPSTAGGTAAVFADFRRNASRVFFRRFDDGLKPATVEVELSDATTTNATLPSIVRLGSAFAATWLETVGGSTRLVLARLGNDGLPAWTRTVATGAGVFGDPRLAATAGTDTNLAVVWVGSDLALRGAAYDGTGNVLQATKTLLPSADAGGDLFFGADVVRRVNTGDFLIGWIGQNNGFRLRFQAFSNNLTPIGAAREVAVSGETPQWVRVAIAGGTNEVSGAWIGSGGGTANVRWLLNALTTPASEIAATFQGQATDLALATTAAGLATFWAQGGTGARLVGLSLFQDAGVGTVRDLTPSGFTGLYAPGVASLDGGVLHVGYEADRGGTALNLFGQVVCSP